MATKYEKLEAEYKALETPEQQWAWVLAHKEMLIVLVDYGLNTRFLIKAGPQNKSHEIGEMRSCYGHLLILLSVLGIEAEEV